MDDKMTKKYEDSIDFWNQAQSSSADDYKGEINQAEDWKVIGSEGLLKLLTDKTKGWNNVLDYGCGNGWADVILERNGAEKITAVDVAEKAVESAKLYANAFCAGEKIEHLAVDVEWLSKQHEDLYDHAICCNVLDVVPMEVSENIAMNLARVCKSGAMVLITLNPFFTEELRNREGIVYEEPYMYVNGILRVNNHTDEEWKTFLSKYFEVEGLDHFKWDVEKEERRRFFRLRVR